MIRTLLLLILVSPAFGQITAGNYGQGGPSGSGVSTVSTGAITGCATAGAYFFVGSFTNQNGSAGYTVASTSISSGNWHQSALLNTETGYFWAYSASITDSEVITVTKSGSLYVATIKGQCFAGVNATFANQLDQTNSYWCGNNTYGSSCQPGSITPTQASELIVSGCIDNKNEINSVNSGFTAIGTLPLGGSQAYLIQTSVSAVNPTWAFTTDYHYFGCWIASFKAASPTLDYTVSGPSSGPDYNASTAFTVSKVSGNWNGSMTIIIADGLQGGVITPSVGSPGTSTVTVTPTNGSSSFTFTYTPNVVGAITLSFSGTGMAGSNPNPSIYTSIALTITNSCVSSTGVLGVASSTCTITASLTFNGTQTVTLADDSEYVCGTFTPSVGSPACGTVTVTPSSGSTFTYTYTPLGPVGLRIFVVTNNFSATNPANVTYTATSADVCTMTAAAAGNWNAAGTWTPSGCTGGGHTTPVTGDTVVMGAYHVTCSTGTCALGTAPANNTTYNLTIASGGELEVASGATLFLTGNYKLNSSSGTNTALLKIDTGATFVHDNANGSVQYRGYGGASANWNNIVFGTQGDVCTFSSSFGYSCQTKYIGVDVAGGYNPVLFAMGTLYDDITYQIYGSSFKSCGASAVPCLDYGSNNNANGYANAGVIDVEDSVFDTTSTLGSAGTYYASALTKLTWLRNRTLNDIIGWITANPTHMLGLAGAINTCTVSGNYFASETGGTGNSGTDYFQGCVWSGNVFALGWMLNISSTHPTGTFQNNVVVTAGSFSFPSVHWANLNNVWLTTTTGPSSAHMGPAWDTVGPYKLIGSVAQKWNTTSASEGHCGYGGDSATGEAQYILDNLGIVGNQGDPPCQWWDSANGANPGPGTVGYVDHNGSNGIGYIAWLMSDGHGALHYPNNAVIGSIRSNLNWASASASQNLVMGDQQSAGTAPNTMIGASSVVDWNDNYNGYGSNLFSGGLDPNCNPSTYNSTPYQICASTGGPGAHEKTVSPKYVDTTRGFDTWASRIKGQASSLIGYLQALWQCSDIRSCIDQSWAWVRQGWQPTNLALKGTAHDGKIIGFSGTLGSGYSGTCGVTITPRDAWDLGGTIAPHAASAICTFSGGVPQITLVSGGAHYRVATPATVAVTGTCTGGCVAASLVPIIQPSDIGPVSIAILPSAF